MNYLTPILFAFSRKVLAFGCKKRFQVVNADVLLTHATRPIISCIQRSLTLVAHFPKFLLERKYLSFGVVGMHFLKGFVNFRHEFPNDFSSRIFVSFAFENFFALTSSSHNICHKDFFVFPR
ncbi:hypothetical protein E0H52_25255 [Rhizobium leguminosarum bv. viciae]|uniref:Uncharacterized protein n=1 Tax=Rhizobium leguminosarum bv. viciae TaxID=387 RepID=A0A8G2IUT4_RHILV|nr:hypothetical protein E0H31_25565 [Rhizobium leguminosarum bv. viciae]TBZ13988.1 hypothetical protein E0H52_25255 [Rhizobium leguminosarum bv. viciae]